MMLLQKTVRNGTLPLFVLGGVIFTLFFYGRYSQIDDQLYQVRDDGVIVMSHARNWVDYGFIGINPSGDRVEGYSAPVQFFLYAVAYGLGRFDYDTFATVQTATATFPLGSLFILFFRRHWPVAVLLTALAAWTLSQHNTSFLLWHGSGMENALTHVLFLASVLMPICLVRSDGLSLGRRGLAGRPFPDGTRPPADALVAGVGCQGRCRGSRWVASVTPRQRPSRRGVVRARARAGTSGSVSSRAGGGIPCTSCRSTPRWRPLPSLLWNLYT